MRFYLDKDDSVNLRRKRIETSLSTRFEKGILSSHYTVVIEHKAFFLQSVYKLCSAPSDLTDILL